MDRLHPRNKAEVITSQVKRALCGCVNIHSGACPGFPSQVPTGILVLKQQKATLTEQTVCTEVKRSWGPRLRRGQGRRQAQQLGTQLSLEGLSPHCCQQACLGMYFLPAAQGHRSLVCTVHLQSSGQSRTHPNLSFLGLEKLHPPLSGFGGGWRALLLLLLLLKVLAGLVSLYVAVSLCVSAF